MHETTADVRRDIEETRARVSRTLAELEGEVDGRRAAVTERVVAVKDGVASTATRVQDTVATFAREHPWYALGAAVGIGLLVGRSRADEAAARAVVSGTRNAASSTAAAAGNAARAGTDKVKSLVQRDREAHAPTAAGISADPHDARVGAIGSSAEDTGALDAAEESGIMYRLRTGVVEALGVPDLLAQMREEADKLGAELRRR